MDARQVSLARNECLGHMFFFVFNGRVIRVGLLFEIDELILDILFTDKDDRNQITHDNGS